MFLDLIDWKASLASAASVYIAGILDVMMKTTKDTSFILGFDEICSLYLCIQSSTSMSGSQRPGVSMTSTPGIVDFNDLKL